VKLRIIKYAICLFVVCMPRLPHGPLSNLPMNYLFIVADTSQMAKLCRCSIAGDVTALVHREFLAPMIIFNSPMAVDNINNKSELMLMRRATAAV